MSAAHPSDELLLAYIASPSSSAEYDWVDAHLRGCDRCLHLLMNISRRHDLLEELHPPEDAAHGQSSRAARGALSGRSAVLNRSVRNPLRLPLLIPAAFAAGLLLAVAARTWVLPRPDSVQMRGVPPRGEMSVRVLQAVMREAPARSAELRGTLEQGAIVRVEDQQSGWCLVTLEDGRTGWLECDTLQ